jgi:16S rRNA (guanine966-N2)-methyltransferase
VRIISGKFRGKQIHPPANLLVRPTTDFAKESLFNILNNLVDFEQIRILDLFSGTGSISFEFFSRGCPAVTAVEINPKCAAFIKKTAEIMHAGNLDAVRSDVFRFIKYSGISWDLIFADPPYEMDSIDTLPEIILNSSILKEGGTFILEHSGNYDFSEVPGFFDHRKYGSVNFSFFRKNLLTGQGTK